MAKQAGIIKLKGTIGDIAFYKSADGHMARFKGGVDGKRIANDPAFQRTRENGAEFGRAGKGGKLLRNSMQGTKSIMLKVKVGYALQGERVEEIHAASNFPALY